MQQELEIDMQIWEYLDELSSEEDRARIALLIEQDAVWQKKYAAAKALQQHLASGTELEQPGMRFRQNVMEAIATEKIAPSTRTYLNVWIIRGIAAIFLVAISFAVVSLLRSGIESSSRDLLPARINYTLPSLPSHTIIYGMLLPTVIAALVLLDTLLRRRRSNAG